MTLRFKSSTASTVRRLNGIGKSFVRPRTATAGSAFGPIRTGGTDGSVVMAYLETVCLNRSIELVLGSVTNVRSQFALADCIDERANFLVIAAHLHFDPTVDAVAHPALYLEALRDVPDCPPKTDTLDTPFKVNLDRRHADCRSYGRLGEGKVRRE